jgi:hypothetical protein
LSLRPFLRTASRAMKMNRRRATVLTGSAMVVLLGALVVAQDFRGQQGGNRRDGRPTLSASTPALTAETTFNNPGRGFLRWWSPAREAEARMDNDESLTGTITGTSAPLNGTWTTPAAIGAIDLAFNYDQETIGSAPYRLARTTAQTLNSTDETSGSTAAYRWRFTNLTPGVEYQLFVNMPIGPTAPGFPANANDFPQRHFVYEIEGAVGGDEIQVVDLFLFGGGQVPLGSGGDVTTRTFVPTGTELSIVLHNTTPRSSQGSFLDPQAAPGQEWVYADSATIQTMVDGAALGSSGVTVAELALAPPTGASALDANFNNRAVYSRNEEFILGETGISHPIGMVNSFTYDGTVVNLAGAPSRLNKAWTFPVAASATTASAETSRVNRDTRDWLLGPETAFSRNRVRHVRDDLLASSLITGTDFVRQTPAVLPFTSNGPTWVESPVRATPTSTVAYDVNVPDGFYFLQVWIPPDDTGTNFTREARYTLQRGVNVIDTFTVDQSTGNGWVSLPGQPNAGYEHINGSGELRLTIDNSGPTSENGRIVYADAIRIVGNADLSVTSTPAFVQMQMPDAGPSLTNRDVVIVASEDGKIRALDAHGDRTTGTTSQYWVYPPENAVDFTDTNRAARNGGVAEEPTGFGRSAPAVARMANGRDYVFAAAENGRVYALRSSTTDSAGVERAWTWPNDYNPASPTTVGQPAEADEIVSSVVVANAPSAPSGQVVIVALQSGRIVALDAQGVAGENRTTVLWQINGPAPAQLFRGFTTTPIISESGDLIFGAEETTAGTGMVVSVSVDTGAVNWTVTTAGGNAVGTFTHGGGTTAPFGAFANGLNYFVDDNGLYMAIDNLGAVDFSFVDPTVVPGAPLQTTFITAFNSGGVQTANTLAVMIPTQGGQLVGYHGEDITNLSGGRRIWQDNFEGQGLPSSIAVGGKRTGELRSWMYAADSEGYLYAYNGNDDVNPAPISPGIRPGREVIVENDPADGELDTVLDSMRLHMVSWTTYTNIRTGLASGWTTAQVAAAVSADRADFTRRSFEVGESLYLVAFGLPDLTASSTGSYYLEFILKGAMGESRVSARTLPTATANELACVWAIPLQVNGPLVPGQNSITARAVPVARRNVASVQVAPQAPTGSLTTGDVFTLANPLAVGFFTTTGTLVNSAGDTTDATAAQNTANGVTILDPGSNAGLRKEAGGGPVLPGAYAGSNPFEFTGAVAHAGVGVSRMVVKDRSLSFLLFGTGRGRANATRGLPGVRMESGDLVWQVRDINGVAQADRNVVGALPAAYTNFEQPPNIEPNLSLDYPDINRSQLTGRRSAFGRSANPFLSEVSLDAPAFTDANLTAYRTAAGFNTQLARTLTSSQFELQVNVPKYQPASGPEAAPISDRRGYIGLQSVFVQARGESFDGTQAHRQVSLGIRVAADRNIRTTTPTLDLGSLPMGSGFDGGPSGAPQRPWSSVSQFRPWNGGQAGRYSQQFAEFTVLNEGNVNLQNLRVAKGIDELNGFTLRTRPLFMRSNDNDGLGLLESRLMLYTSLDPRWSETGAQRSNFEPAANVRLVKPRPGDPIGTILSTNPVRRQNPFLGSVAGSPLLDPALFPIGNPRLGVAVPLGTPSGEFVTQVAVIEDFSNGSVDSLAGFPDVPLPALGPVNPIPTRTDILEPFTDPGITIRFRVREARMTNGITGRGSALVDSSSPAGAFSWENAGAALMRDGSGAVWTVYASNRQTDGSGLLLPRPGTATPQASNWRIFLSQLRSFTNSGTAGDSPTRDLTQFISSSSGPTWFQRGLTLPNVGSPSTIFTVGAGQAVVAGSEQFHSPDLPSNGPFIPLQAGPVRTSIAQPFLAYLGTATVRDNSGQESTIERVFLEQLQSISATAGPPIEVNDAFGSRFSKPSVVQNAVTASVFYTASAGSTGQLRSTTVINGVQQTPRGYSLGDGFSELGAPSVSLRRYQDGSNTGVVDLVLPAKRTGKASNELFVGRLETSASGVPTGSVLRYPMGLQRLEREGGQPVFFAAGAAWSTAAADIAQFQLAMTDAGSPNGLRPLIRPGTVNLNRETGQLRAQTTLGGEVTADVRTGRVQLTNAAIPVGRDLYVIVSPGLILASEGSGAAYRTADSAFDDRLIPVLSGTGLGEELAAVSYWYNEVGAGFRSTAPLAPITNDRLHITASATPAGTARTVRPVMKSMRFGVQLPFPIAVDPSNGEPLVTVEWNQLGNPLVVPAASRRYQVDAAKGRIYLPAGAEDFNVVIRYQAADSTGNAIATIAAAIYPVTMITEASERLVPIEQATNDVSLSLALDPPTAAYQNVDYRRPSLLWMAWTSTRAGVTDIYMQTVAPRFAILPPGG